MDTHTNNFYHHVDSDANLKHRRASIGSMVHAEPLTVVLPTDKVTLKRHLGLFSGICFIIGIVIGKSSDFALILMKLIYFSFLILGSGIFISPKGVLRGTQSIGLCLIVWIACGLLSLIGLFQKPFQYL